MRQCEVRIYAYYHTRKEQTVGGDECRFRYTTELQTEHLHTPVIFLRLPLP